MVWKGHCQLLKRWSSNTATLMAKWVTRQVTMLWMARFGQFGCTKEARILRVPSKTECICLTSSLGISVGTLACKQLSFRTLTMSLTYGKRRVCCSHKWSTWAKELATVEATQLSLSTHWVPRTKQACPLELILVITLKLKLTPRQGSTREWSITLTGLV